MKALFLTVLLALSCTKKPVFEKDAMGIRLRDVHMNVSHLNEIEWHVGKNKEATVSQSFTFLVEMPLVDEDDLDYLTEEKEINAWIIRVILQQGSERLDLGSLYAPFKPKKVIRGQAGGAPTSVALKVYYAAAYPSERFRFFNCPAFEHNKRISKMAIKGTDEPFEITFAHVTPYSEKSQLVELAPSSFNGGNSLKGEYFLEIAPYNHEKKVIFSSFKRLPVYVEVSSEESISVPSCLGVHQERN